MFCINIFILYANEAFCVLFTQIFLKYKSVIPLNVTKTKLPTGL